MAMCRRAPMAMAHSRWPWGPRPAITLTCRRRILSAPRTAFGFAAASRSCCRSAVEADRLHHHRCTNDNQHRWRQRYVDGSGSVGCADGRRRAAGHRDSRCQHNPARSFTAGIAGSQHSRSARRVARFAPLYREYFEHG